jgi:hypothetical protein
MAAVTVAGEPPPGDTDATMSWTDAPRAAGSVGCVGRELVPQPAARTAIVTKSRSDRCRRISNLPVSIER